MVAVLIETKKRLSQFTIAGKLTETLFIATLHKKITSCFLAIVASLKFLFGASRPSFG